MLKHLKELCCLSGVSGDEGQVQNYLIEQLRGVSGITECRADRLGNLLVHKQGAARAPQRILLSAHMDEVGMLVTDIHSDGTLAFATVGGIEESALLGSQVLVGAGAINGVIGAKAVHHLSAKEREAIPACSQLSVDIGAADRAAAEQLVRRGDVIGFLPLFEAMQDDFVCAKAIDDRAGCAILLNLLEGELPFDTWFSFCVQEEVGLRGAKCAAYAVEPELALVLETTTAADYPAISGADRVCALGQGAVVPFMDRTTLYDRGLYALAFETAQAAGIPIQTKTRIAGGNDAGAIHTSRAGVRTLTVSVPCRNLHSPATVAKLSDIDACYALAQALLPRLGAL